MLKALFFGLALGFLRRRRVGWAGAIGTNRATVSGLGENGSQSTQDDQDDSEREPNPGGLGNGSHMLRPAKQKTHDTKPGDGDADSDEGFGRYRRDSARFLRTVHGEKIGEAKTFSELAI